MEQTPDARPATPAGPQPGAASLLAFFAIAFGLAWGLILLLVLAPDRVTATFGPVSAHNPLFILAVYAPALAALALVARHAGLPGLRRFLSRLLLWRCPAPYWALLLLGIPAVYLAGALIKGTAATDLLPDASPGEILAALAFMAVLGPVEEIGWRGYALPILQRHMAPLWAGLVLGLIWGLWHLPAFGLSGTPQSAWSFTPFLIGSIAVSVILTPMFNAAGGSILIAMLFHWQLNNPIWPDAQPWDTPLFAALALAVVWLDRRTMFTRGTGTTAVIPPSVVPMDPLAWRTPLL